MVITSKPPPIVPTYLDPDIGIIQYLVLFVLRVYAIYNGSRRVVIFLSVIALGVVMNGLVSIIQLSLLWLKVLTLVFFVDSVLSNR